MVDEARTAELSAIAAQLAGRVRDEDPKDVALWLRIVAPTEADIFQLCFVLAAAVPDDRPFADLVAWTGEPVKSKGVQERITLRSHSRWIKDMRKRGMSAHEVADVLGVTASAVRRVAREAA